jgi:hypothetical protein
VTTIATEREDVLPVEVMESVGRARRQWYIDRGYEVVDGWDAAAPFGDDLPAFLDGAVLYRTYSPEAKKVTYRADTNGVFCAFGLLVGSSRKWRLRIDSRCQHGLGNAIRLSWTAKRSPDKHNA